MMAARPGYQCLHVAWVTRPPGAIASTAGPRIEFTSPGSRTRGRRGAPTFSYFPRLVQFQLGGCATKHAPRNPFNVLERRHGLTEIVERGAGGRRAPSRNSLILSVSSSLSPRTRCATGSVLRNRDLWLLRSAVD